MRRVLGYHLWHADWWEERAFARTDLSPAEAEGAAAYAFRQSSIRIAIHNHCQSSWADVARYVGLGEGIERSGLLGFEQVTPEIDGHENGSSSPSPTRGPCAQEPLFTPTLAEIAIPTLSATRVLAQHPLLTPTRSGPVNTSDPASPTPVLAEHPLASAARAAPIAASNNGPIVNAWDGCGADDTGLDNSTENVMDID